MHMSATCLFVGPKPDERGNVKKSTLQLFEDDNPLGPQHISSDDIAREGHGMYLFWGEKGETALVFSASDNSDKNANGRTYRAFDPLD
jgi:membrane-bound inhibitor of C-type lysozyme